MMYNNRNDKSIRRSKQENTCCSCPPPQSGNHQVPSLKSHRSRWFKWKIPLWPPLRARPLGVRTDRYIARTASSSAPTSSEGRGAAVVVIRSSSRPAPSFGGGSMGDESGGSDASWGLAVIVATTRSSPPAFPSEGDGGLEGEESSKSDMSLSLSALAAAPWGEMETPSVGCFFVVKNGRHRVSVQQLRRLPSPPRRAAMGTKYQANPIGLGMMGPSPQQYQRALVAPHSAGAAM
jgi:hypothetical protein